MLSKSSSLIPVNNICQSQSFLMIVQAGIRAFLLQLRDSHLSLVPLAGLAHDVWHHKVLSGSEGYQALSYLLAGRGVLCAVSAYK